MPSHTRFLAIVLLAATAGTLTSTAAAKATPTPAPSTRLTNVVTDWINATQARVTVLGVHNVPASRWYAQTALAIHNAVAAGGAPAQALAGRSGCMSQGISNTPMHNHILLP
jgi:hypothetical protein